MTIEAKTKVVTLSARPANVPADWLIFNAPRPIPGSMQLHWHDEWFHGRFYVAIDPSAENAAWMISECNSLDAWQLEYKSESDAVAYMREYYAREYAGSAELPDILRDVDTDPIIREQAVSAYLMYVNAHAR